MYYKNFWIIGAKIAKDDEEFVFYENLRILAK